MQRFYETVFIARQDITANQVDTMAQGFNQMIKDAGGQVAKTELCGLRNLAYPIKKNKKGHYVLMNFAVDSDTVKEMERTMRLDENVLRYMTVRAECLDKNPSVLMQQKSFKETVTKYDEVDPAEFKRPAKREGY
ncbi:MAG TPA: 30S ribosomal protein S6 [Holosporales bacterium]|nr:30S ribosomal protein S6 [Holosporales bacterium]